MYFHCMYCFHRGLQIVFFPVGQFLCSLKSRLQDFKWRNFILRPKYLENKIALECKNIFHGNRDFQDIKSINKWQRLWRCTTSRKHGFRLQFPLDMDYHCNVNPFTCVESTIMIDFHRCDNCRLDITYVNGIMSKCPPLSKGKYVLTPPTLQVIRWWHTILLPYNWNKDHCHWPPPFKSTSFTNLNASTNFEWLHLETKLM